MPFGIQEVGAQSYTIKYVKLSKCSIGIDLPLPNSL
jgi:hypothetical protein